MLEYLEHRRPSRDWIVGYAAALARLHAIGTEPRRDLTDACAGWLIRGDALVERAHRESADHLARTRTMIGSGHRDGQAAASTGSAWSADDRRPVPRRAATAQASWPVK